MVLNCEPFLFLLLLSRCCCSAAAAAAAAVVRRYLMPGILTFFVCPGTGGGSAGLSCIHDSQHACIVLLMLEPHPFLCIYKYIVFILRRMGKNKAQAPTLPCIRYMSCFDLTHAPVATTARAAATEPHPAFTRTVVVGTSSGGCSLAALHRYLVVTEYYSYDTS